MNQLAFLMNKTAIGLLLSGLLLTACVRHPEISVREFFKNPDSCAYRLSPNGTQISFLKSSGKSHRLNIFIKSVAGGEATCVTSEEARNISPYYFWKDDDHIVYFVDLVDDPKGEWHVRCVDLKQHQVEDRTPAGFVDIIDQLSSVPGKILVNIRGDVYRLDVFEGLGKTELVRANPGDFLQWITDQGGNLRGAIAGDSVTLRLMRLDPDGEFKPVLYMDFRESIAPIKYNFLDEGERPTQFRFVSGIAPLVRAEEKREVLYALSNIRGEKCRDKYALVKVDPENGKELAEIYANPDFDVNDIEVSKKGRVICAKFMTWRNERKCIDPSAEAWYDRLGQQFPNDDVQIMAYNDAETKMIVKRSSDQNPGEYYLFELGTGKLNKLGEYAPHLRGQLAPIEPTSFISRDQRVINGYLTLPRGPKRTNLPLIVVPHGGPWWRNVWGFTRENQEVQFFANRGYAVLQLNFRSSMGYGREFWTSGFKQWGQTMQNDVTDGVLWAIKQKIADPKRIAIVGESYGGYAALAGIAFTQQVHYVAAVDRAGISDLLLLFKEYQGYPMLPQLRQKIGDPDHPPQNEMLAKYSPLLHCDRITTPLLIAHGTFDQVVAPEQSTKMYNALEKQGKKVEVKYLPEGHIFQNEENLITYYEAVDAFLKKHLR